MNKQLEDQIYAEVAREIADNFYHPASMARAVEKSNGDSDRAKSLYIRFRFDQLAHEHKVEAHALQEEAKRRQLMAEEAARAEALAIEKEFRIRQLADKQLAASQREKKALEARRLKAEARAAAEARAEARAKAKAEARAEAEAAQDALNDSGLVCGTLLVLTALTTFLLGWGAISSIIDGNQFLAAFLISGILGNYAITYHHFRARRNRQRDRSK
jgi:hypothetical protein